MTVDQVIFMEVDTREMNGKRSIFSTDRDQLVDFRESDSITHGSVSCAS